MGCGNLVLWLNEAQWDLKLNHGARLLRDFEKTYQENLFFSSQGLANNSFIFSFTFQMVLVNIFLLFFGPRSGRPF